MNGSTSRASVEIPDELYQRLASKARESMFQDVSELCEFVLAQFLEIEDTRSKPSLSENDERELKDRLKRLGYD